MQPCDYNRVLEIYIYPLLGMSQQQLLVGAPNHLPSLSKRKHSGNFPKILSTDLSATNSCLAASNASTYTDKAVRAT